MEMIGTLCSSNNKEKPLMDIVQLIDIHRNRITSIIRKWCRKPQDFDDILQNIFLKLFTTKAEFKGKSKVETWLYRVTVNECIDFYRKNKRFTKGWVDIEGVFLIDEFGNPEKDARKRELKMKIEEIIGELDEKSRTAFTLYFICEKSIKEISDILNISRNAVRCRIYKAKVRVIEKAKNKGII
jgi:RNA polymerase sigma-70 factor (ECF subfamily)